MNRFFSSQSFSSRLTVKKILKMHKENIPITMITAYDYITGKLADSTADVILVGDSLGMTALGYSDTTKVTIEDMIHHCKAVSRASEHALLVGDLPFGSYRDTDRAVRNAIKLVQEGNMNCVKLEGGKIRSEVIKAILREGVPVMGHIGLSPQQLNISGYSVCGKTSQQALDLLEDAKELQEAGCFSIVLEAVPEIVAKALSDTLNIPTIGIGAGRNVSGQVLVQSDILGLNFTKSAKFVKEFADLKTVSLSALSEFREQVRGKEFPQSEHTYPMQLDEEKEFLMKIQKN